MPKPTNKPENQPQQLDLFSLPKQPETAPPKKAPQEDDRWLSVTYKPVSLFSLKRSDATSMAARSNLVPTPYAIKMALLKVLIESEAARHRDNFDRWIQSQFSWIRALQVHILPPKHLVVNRNGYKLRYYNQQAEKDYKKLHGEPPSTLPMQGGFVFREWVHLDGDLKICCGETSHLEKLDCLFAQINYFGKRSCFFQYLPPSVKTPRLPSEFDFQRTAQTIGFTVQPMDDLGDKTTFDRINPFSNTTAKLDRDRVVQSSLLPLELVATTARYDVYKRY